MEHIEQPRHSEFMAYLNTTLGADYCVQKTIRLEELQIELLSKQAELHNSYQNRNITIAIYVEELNSLSTRIFNECHALLGDIDFNNFFGFAITDQQWLVDVEAIAAEEELYRRALSAAYDRTDSLELGLEPGMTPEQVKEKIDALVETARQKSAS